MTSWQISESGTSVSLNDKGEGEVTFTVTNNGTAQDRVVLTVTPLDGAADDWFTIDEPQRAVPAGQSVVYKVAIKVKDDTAAGTYALQGVAYSADTDPSESSVTSKRVEIVVIEREPPKPFPKWPFIVAAVVLALIVIGIIIFLLTRDGGFKNEDPPTISGTPEVLQTLTADPGKFSEENDVEFAFQWLRCDADNEDDCDDIEGATTNTFAPGNDDVGKRIRVEVTAKNADDDEATAQSEPTDPVEPAAAVQFPVPNVFGLSQSAATAAISQHFQVVVLTAGSFTGNCDPPVSSQNPGANTLLTQGEQVTIAVTPISIFQCGFFPGPIIFAQPEPLFFPEELFNDQAPNS
jgi:hypothetical protein